MNFLHHLQGLPIIKYHAPKAREAGRHILIQSDTPSSGKQIMIFGTIAIQICSTVVNRHHGWALDPRTDNRKAAYAKFF